MSTSYSFPGSLLYGNSSNLPIFGRYGKLLYSSKLMTTQATVVIDWGDDDVDICAHWVGFGGNVGYGLNATTEAGIYSQYWESNDNTDGGPETVIAGVKADSFPQSATWRVHLNWFRGGPGTAEVTIKPPVGDPVTITSNVANRAGESAETSDPGVEVVFNNNNTIMRVTLINQ